MINQMDEDFDRVSDYLDVNGEGVLMADGAVDDIIVDQNNNMEDEEEEEISDGEEDMFEEEDESKVDYNQQNPFFRNLNETEDKIVKLMEYSNNLVSFIQSQEDKDNESENHEKIVLQFLNEIKVCLLL